MIDTVTEAAPSGGDVLSSCALAVAVWNRAPIGDIASLRKEIAAAYPNSLPAAALKQTDDQNLPALFALKQALERANLTAEQCSQWGLVAAPRMPGRKRIAESLGKFRSQGAWSSSPHIIPNCSLHSASGLFSQALQLHGPNLGAGGMPASEGEALWAALSLLNGENLPGIWIVFMGLDRETLDAEAVHCQTAVLGLRPRKMYPHLPRLNLRAIANADGAPAFSLESLGQAIQSERDAHWRIGGAVCDMSFRAAELEAAA